MENVMVETREEPNTTACICKAFWLQLNKLKIMLAVIYKAYSFIVISALGPLLATKIRSG